MDRSIFDGVFNDFLNVNALNAGEKKDGTRNSLVGPRPFTYLFNESNLSNQLLAGKSNAESSVIKSNAESIVMKSNAESIGVKSNAEIIGMKSNAESIVMKSNTTSIGMKSNAERILMKSNAESIGLNSNAQSSVMKSNAESIVMKSNAKGSVMKSNAESIGFKFNAASSVMKSNAESIVTKSNAKSSVLKSNAESSVMKVEQATHGPSDWPEMEVKYDTMRNGVTDVSTRTHSSISQSAQVISRHTVRKTYVSQMAAETLTKKDECSTFTENHSNMDETLLMPNEKHTKRTFSLNIRRNAESSFDRLVRHFDATLYQNYFFLEEAKQALGQDQIPAIEDVTHKPLAIEMSKNLEAHEDNFEKPKSPKLEAETNVTRSNSKVLKDLVEPQQISRKLWSHMPQVKASGYLEKATTAQKHLQEAKFEVISSEASYYRSLLVLETHFALRLTNFISKAQHKFIFGHVKKVRKVSESVVKALSKCFENNLLMSNMCHILYDLVKDNFQIYITYCKNHPLIEKTLEEVRKQPQFEKALHNLELEPVCQNLKINSFLILPMQRFLRMPLLVETILKKLTPQDIEFKTWDKLLKLLKKKAEECNNACGEMDKIAKQYIIIRDLAVSLLFTQGIPPLALQSSSRTLLLQDMFTIIYMTETIATEVGTIRITLLSDYLIIAKPVGNKHYRVITYCKKEKASIKAGEDSSPKRYVVLKLSANYKGESERWFLGFENAKKSDEISKNWLEALPHCDDELYEIDNMKMTKDGKTVQKATEANKDDINDKKSLSTCQDELVKVIYEFSPSKSDELELKPGEFLRVKSESKDGWCFGERVGDGKAGWFPKNYTSLVSETEEIAKTLKLELV